MRPRLRVQVAHDVALARLGHDDDELAHRFEQHRPALASASLRPIDGRGLERHLGAVDGVVLAVEAR